VKAASHGLKSGSIPHKSQRTIIGDPWRYILNSRNRHTLNCCRTSAGSRRRKSFAAPNILAAEIVDEAALAQFREIAGDLAGTTIEG
jgi:hypothetical protein